MTKLPAAILWSQLLGWALCIRRGTGWVAVGVRRSGSRGGPACRPLRGPLGGALGPPRPSRAAGAGERRFCALWGYFSSRWRGKLVRLSAAPTWSFTGACNVDCRSLRLVSPSLQRNVEGTACLPRRLL